MKKRLRNRAARRLADDLRWWLLHDSSCCSCGYDPDGEFSRVGRAISNVLEYLRDPSARYPVRIPRRFWRDLGRVADPMAFVNRMRRYSASRFGLPSNNEADSPVD